MNHHRLRRALLCVAATYGALLATSAEASRTVTIGPGDSLDSLARRFHVAKRDIARANGIGVEAVLIDGRRLIIPDPPALVSHEPTLREPATIRGDRITIRRGPNEGYRRMTLLDHGAPVTVTHRAGDWCQVALDNGGSGWVRSDFLAAAGASRAAAAPAPPVRRAARTSVAAKPSSDHRVRAASSKEARERRAERRREAQREARAERKHELAAERARERRHRMAAERRRERLAAQRSRRTRVAVHHTRHSRPEAGAPSADDTVVRTAYSYRGTPYRFGGSGRRGFDCSGFTSYVYGRKGVSLPHSASEQFHEGRSVGKGQLKPGDLVFFHTTRRGISHVGIYAGEGKFVHASSGGGRVRVDSLQSGYYRNRFRGARRVK